jgi:hypothetical protein
MNSKEALELTNKNIDPKVNSILLFILDKIKAACEDGHFKILYIFNDYSDIVIDRVEQKLTSLGYKISRDVNLHDRTYFEISWE